MADKYEIDIEPSREDDEMQIDCMECLVVLRKVTDVNL